MLATAMLKPPLESDPVQTAPSAASAGQTEAGAGALSDPLVAWLLASARGDGLAFRQLYASTRSRLFGIAMLLLRRRDAAEDVLQEAYIRIWSGAGQYSREKGEPLPWLAKIVRNAAVDRLRRERVIAVEIETEEDLPQAKPAMTGEHIDLERSLARLDPARRRATLMSALYGYTNEEIAARLGVPLGTAKTWIRRGKQRLRAQLEG